MTDSLEKFKAWSDAHNTHMARFLLIVSQQVENQRKYVELFRTYPANSFEMRDGIQTLYLELGNLLEECRETADSLGEDLEKFKDVLETVKEEMEKIYVD